MKQKTKSFLYSFAPDILNLYQAINNRRYFKKRYNNFQNNLTSSLFPQNNISVLFGPFKGMKYINEVVWGSITPKWLGSYECELHSVIEEIIKIGYDTIIDVGCAEGYYAVGMAFRIPQAYIYAYDTDFLSRKQVRRLIKLNNLESRICVKKFCSHNEIEKIARNSTLIICDIEGFERELLNPIKCQILKKIDILVEVHEGFGKPLTINLLKERFQESHLIQEIDAQSRHSWIKDNEEKIHINSKILSLATEESRSNGQKWLFMKRK
ncbi:hypothetical protein GS597_15885 [Synechococcales cyanobacterium C]|uniref:Methyltransferase FkbM domain-containing protein n=1 Tax=Petrachloros mirabilis ULC683 TaxID=2781853 RepID=A0A8K2A980_9CYAN|nr:50S ribosomal protein L11 methyltransferase [Petrachloros mirabilis]NCJ07959.1 hypothetical protein [Petrachloros mirabilis ULC683]